MQTLVNLYTAIKTLSPGLATTQRNDPNNPNEFREPPTWGIRGWLDGFHPQGFLKTGAGDVLTPWRFGASVISKEYCWPRTVISYSCFIAWCDIRLWNDVTDSALHHIVFHHGTCCFTLIIRQQLQMCMSIMFQYLSKHRVTCWRCNSSNHVSPSHVPILSCRH